MAKVPVTSALAMSRLPNPSVVLMNIITPIIALLPGIPTPDVEEDAPSDTILLVLQSFVEQLTQRLAIERTRTFESLRSLSNEREADRNTVQRGAEAIAEIGALRTRNAILIEALKRIGDIVDFDGMPPIVAPSFDELVALVEEAAGSQRKLRINYENLGRQFDLRLPVPLTEAPLSDLVSGVYQRVNALLSDGVVIPEEIKARLLDDVMRAIESAPDNAGALAGLKYDIENIQTPRGPRADDTSKFVRDLADILQLMEEQKATIISREDSRDGALNNFELIKLYANGFVLGSSPPDPQLTVELSEPEPEPEEPPHDLEDALNTVLTHLIDGMHSRTHQNYDAEWDALFAWRDATGAVFIGPTDFAEKWPGLSLVLNRVKEFFAIREAAAERLVPEYLLKSLRLELDDVVIKAVIRDALKAKIEEIATRQRFEAAVDRANFAVEKVVTRVAGWFR